MSKTATKKTKKPDPKAAGERALNQRKIAMEEEALRIRRIVSKMLEPVHERLTALESRSAPAEEWPLWRCERGSLVRVATVNCPFAKGSILRITAAGAMPCAVLAESKELDAGVMVSSRDLKPLSEAEIASHKAKEEQRAKEAEWAKYDVLQPGDACLTDKDQFAELVNLAKPLDCILEPHWGSALIGYRKERDWRHGYKPTPDQNLLPFAEFKRRLQGTIAKRLEDERAKELAKVPEFGTRVKWDTWTGRVACEGPDHENQYLVAYKPGHGSVWHSTWVRRRDLTIID